MSEPSAMDYEEIMVDGREVTIPYATALTLYKIAFEAHGLTESDFAARRVLGSAICATERATSAKQSL